MNCDMCGKEKQLYNAEIEGVDLNVCIECAKHGKINRSAQKEPTKKEKARQEKREEEIIKLEVIERIVTEYNNKIKIKREKIGLKQQELAKAINEKESLIHNIETGSFKPSIQLAKKISSFLKIELIEKYEEKKYDSGQQTDKGEFTLGDYVKIKKK